MPGKNPLAVSSEIVEIGSLVKTALVAGQALALGGTVTIPGGTRYRVVQKQVHKGDDAVAECTVRLVDSAGNEYDRLSSPAGAGTDQYLEDMSGTGRLINPTVDTTFQIDVIGGVAITGQLSVAALFKLRQIPK